MILLFQRKNALKKKILMKDIIDFSSRDMLLGYALGIFPMANSADDDSVMWLHPNRRGIIPLENLHISKSLRRKLNSKKYHSTFNKDFFHKINDYISLFSISICNF